MRVMAAASVLSGLLLSVPAFAKPVEAVLRLQERVSMAELARSVTDPSSPRYRQYYTPTEILSLAGPSAAEYERLVNKLHQAGFEVVQESATHLTLTVRGELSTFAHVFSTQVQSFADGTRQVLNDALVPESLSPVVSINGLDNHRHAFPLFKVLPQNGPNAGFAGVSPEQIRTLYGFDSLYQQGLSGAGQHIAIATYDNFYIDDVKQYYKNHNISPAPSVDQVKFNGEPNYVTTNSDVETAIDAQFSGALAPQALIHVFTSAHNDDAGELQLFTAILDDNRAKIVNYSWGGCEVDVTAQHKKDMDAVFNRAVAQGVNILAASGDSGAYCPQQTTTVMADWPAAHPSIVAVGGTRLDTGSARLSEVAWSFDGFSGGGSGGGVSTLWDQPTWQGFLKAPFVKRSYPDVAFNADPVSGQAGWVRLSPFGTHSDTPGEAVIGGTSIASPQWAGFLALVGEARAKAGKKPIGYLNPIIYAMSPGDQAASFDPIISGNNGAYQAGPGWNAVCGWGGLRADGLLAYLSAY